MSVTFNVTTPLTMVLDGTDVRVNALLISEADNWVNLANGNASAVLQAAGIQADDLTGAVDGLPFALAMLRAALQSTDPYIVARATDLAEIGRIAADHGAQVSWA